MRRDRRARSGAIGSSARRRRKGSRNRDSRARRSTRASRARTARRRTTAGRWLTGGASAGAAHRPAAAAATGRRRGGAEDMGGMPPPAQTPAARAKIVMSPRRLRCRNRAVAAILPGLARRFYEGAWPADPRSSASRPRRPGGSTSATPAPRCSIGCSPGAPAGDSSCASTTPTSSVRGANMPTRSRPISPGSASSPTRLPPVRAHGALRRRGRDAEAGRPALSRLRDGGGTRPPAQAPAGAGPPADLRPRRARARRRRARRARGAGTQAALALQARSERRALGRLGARGKPHRLRLALRSGAAGARTAAISTRCPRWSTTSTSASPMSSAATITSPTPRCKSRSSRRWAAARAGFGHHNLLTDAGGEGLSKRTGALSIRSLRESGVEALAVAALAVLVGSAEAVRPVASLAELAATFDLADISHAAARFDEAELRALSARVLHHLPFAAVRERLEALGVAGPDAEPFWNGDARQSRAFGRGGGVVGRRPRRDRAGRRGPRASSPRRPPACRKSRGTRRPGARGRRSSRR